MKRKRDLVRKVGDRPSAKHMAPNSLIRTSFVFPSDLFSKLAYHAISEYCNQSWQDFMMSINAARRAMVATSTLPVHDGQQGPRNLSPGQGLLIRATPVS
jgi:hypothetical protein